MFDVVLYSEHHQSILNISNHKRFKGPRRHIIHSSSNILTCTSNVTSLYIQRYIQREEEESSSSLSHFPYYCTIILSLQHCTKYNHDYMFQEYTQQQQLSITFP
mmetsp:Transcript_4350/g.4925  ORF Transcript_4350/g.4925 Transcript_4350/m.4925 type:complete len:104 (+) Transcript_4350:74-385(+)